MNQIRMNDQPEMEDEAEDIYVHLVKCVVRAFTYNPCFHYARPQSMLFVH